LLRCADGRLPGRIGHLGRNELLFERGAHQRDKSIHRCAAQGLAAACLALCGFECGEGLRSRACGKPVYHGAQPRPEISMGGRDRFQLRQQSHEVRAD
jgi:hypothetical protein